MNCSLGEIHALSLVACHLRTLQKNRRIVVSETSLECLPVTLSILDVLGVQMMGKIAGSGRLHHRMIAVDWLLAVNPTACVAEDVATVPETRRHRAKCDLTQSAGVLREDTSVRWYW